VQNSPALHFVENIQIADHALIMDFSMICSEAYQAVVIPVMMMMMLM
jgi:hypothetical protein